MKKLLHFSYMTAVFVLSGCQIVDNNADSSLAKIVFPTLSEQDLNSSIVAEKPGQILSLHKSYTNGEYLEKEFKTWYTLYRNGFRNLFMDVGYATGQWLNLWMKSKDDVILNHLKKDWISDKIQLRMDNVLKFFRKIKRLCPETVFHGIDIDHQYMSTEQRYLRYLENNGLKDSDEYKRTVALIKQRKRCYSCEAYCPIYHTNKLVENFVREFEALKGANVLGIYESSNINSDNQKDFTNMFHRLSAIYGNAVHLVDFGKKNVSMCEFYSTEKKAGQILFLEKKNGDIKCFKNKFKLWYKYYHKYEFRHLFLEKGYTTAQLLNLWMKADNDEILNRLEKYLTSTSPQNKQSDMLEFFKKIKKLCPETIFHGTDIEYLADSSGKMYIKYLEDKRMKNSDEYKQAIKAIEQYQLLSNF